MSEKSNENAKRPRVIPSLEMKLIFTVDFEAGKRKNDAAKSAVPGTNECLRSYM
jgi:hypothetical protein